MHLIVKLWFLKFFSRFVALKKTYYFLLMFFKRNCCLNISDPRVPINTKVFPLSNSFHFLFIYLSICIYISIYLSIYLYLYIPWSFDVFAVVPPVPGRTESKEKGRNTNLYPGGVLLLSISRGATREFLKGGDTNFGLKYKVKFVCAIGKVSSKFSYSQNYDL